ncbi:RNA polymerase I subunit A43 [Giardia muris]|uniref:RNA polymerase I subunit A43 n=1 Tax=Giardia muris TaxID=5742 RepID=A0A4Z1SXI9_GIAMU|nr:RNA polymerase I subunit A43 [Giardia muris]|eukprot:TNJ30492.1 RNA polymerase I subunit A43 [Giardia muris]
MTNLVVQQVRLKAATLPHLIGDPLTAVQLYLDQRIFCLVPGVEGIMVGYDSIEILSNSVYISTQTPYMFLEAQCALLMYVPRPGGLIVGRVIQVSSNLIILIHHDAITLRVKNFGKHLVKSGGILRDVKLGRDIDKDMVMRVRIVELVPSERTPIILCDLNDPDCGVVTVDAIREASDIDELNLGVELQEDIPES